jgi:hypothetical protein
VGELLRTHNPELAEYGAVIDSAFPPSFSHYDYADSVLCEQAGACDYEAHQRLEHEHPDGTSHLQGVADEASCAAFHASDGEAWRCADAHHVVSHHVTTPFLLRMGQRDTLLSSTMIDLDFAVDGEPLDLLTFARLVQADAAALADLDTHEEAEHTPRAPAVFIPTCADHEVLSDDAQVYETTIRVGEQDLAMFDVLAGWRLGTGPRVAIAADPSEDHCP